MIEERVSSDHQQFGAREGQQFLPITAQFGVRLTRSSYARRTFSLSPRAQASRLQVSLSRAVFESVTITNQAVERIVVNVDALHHIRNRQVKKAAARHHADRLASFRTYSFGARPSTTTRSSHHVPRPVGQLFFKLTSST